MVYTIISYGHTYLPFLTSSRSGIHWYYLNQCILAKYSCCVIFITHQKAYLLCSKECLVGKWVKKQKLFYIIECLLLIVGIKKCHTCFYWTWIRKMSKKLGSTVKDAKENLLRSHSEESYSGVNTGGGKNALMESMCRNPSFKLTTALPRQQLFLGDFCWKQPYECFCIVFSDQL